MEREERPGLDVRPWHEKVESQLRECPLCGGRPELDVKEREPGAEWLAPGDGDRDGEGLLWRVKCPTCGCMVVGGGWGRLLKAWDRRYGEEKVRSAAEKALGQAEHWLPRIKEMQTRLNVLEGMIGARWSS